jgi:hypothetical protein
MSIEAMKLALEALEEACEIVGVAWAWRDEKGRPAITALRERLAQPEQNPLTEKRIEELYSFWIVDCQDIVGFARAIERSKPQMQPCAGRNCGSTNPNLHSAECFEDYEKSTGMAQPEQEPVAWRWKERINNDFDSWVITSSEPPPYAVERQPLYTAPRKWQGLTDEEIGSLWDGHVVPVFGKNGINPIVFARAIEAKLREKNT